LKIQLDDDNVPVNWFSIAIGTEIRRRHRMARGEGSERAKMRRNSTTSPNGERRGVRKGQDEMKFDDVTEWREERAREGQDETKFDDVTEWREERGQRGSGWAEIRRRHRMARGEGIERVKMG
jgi:hypothetical protein